MMYITLYNILISWYHHPYNEMLIFPSSQKLFVTRGVHGELTEAAPACPWQHRLPTAWKARSSRWALRRPRFAKFCSKVWRVVLAGCLRVICQIWFENIFLEIEDYRLNFIEHLVCLGIWMKRFFPFDQSQGGFRLQLIPLVVTNTLRGEYRS